METRPRKRWLALLLSVIVPGGGHLYLGRTRRGLGFFVAVLALNHLPLALGLASTLTGLLAALGVAGAAWVAMLVDAGRLAGRPQPVSLPPAPAWWAYVLLIAVAVGASFLGRASLRYEAFRVPSGSMEPTLRPEDRFMARRLDPAGYAPARGDVVVHYYPGESPVFVKRVVGLPGETLEIVGGTVLVDGEAIAEPWKRQSGQDPARGAPRDFGPLVIPEAALFTMGDNRDNSRDSREWGSVPLTDVLARALYVYFSPDLGRVGRDLRPADGSKNSSE